ncbi:hypothetical protein CPB85DRAFT_1442993 [Mucidula mucida]|nr:hypothetical protein CPB85DRAFT_1442993 [Mucidula mucida]
MSLYSRPSFLQPAICTSSLPALATFSLLVFSALAVYRSLEHTPLSVLLSCAFTCAVIIIIMRVVKAVATSVMDMALQPSDDCPNRIVEVPRPIGHPLPARPFPLPVPTLPRIQRSSSSDKTLIPSTAKAVHPDEALLRFGERRGADGGNLCQPTTILLDADSGDVWIPRMENEGRLLARRMGRRGNIISEQDLLRSLESKNRWFC